MKAAKNVKKNSYAACSGCGVCLLSCPVWHGTRSMSMTRKARARAMQGGAELKDIEAAIDSCFLCGACEPACPEGIGLVDLNMKQREELNLRRAARPAWYPETVAFEAQSVPVSASTLLLAGKLLAGEPGLCETIIGFLGGKDRAALSADDGRDIGDLMEAGLPVDESRMSGFIASLGKAETLVVAEGRLHGMLRKKLPGKKIIGLGEALMSKGETRKKLSSDDLYIIESRGYHADYKRLSVFYGKLRRETGCETNLDLQRTASSTGASSLRGMQAPEASGCLENARRILKGKKVKRIVVEDMADALLFEKVADVPVLHVASLVFEGSGC